MVCFLLCPDTPPERADAKGGKGVEQGKFIAAQHNPNQFALGLKDACCVEPGCCILSGLGAPFGLTACWTRKAVLDKYAGGMQNYVCFQGYIPNCCCMDTSDMCRGSELGLCLEGCCCPVFSISIARLHLMDAKRIRPDPWDYQIIAFSNCLQLASCILDIIAIFVEEAREAANIVDLIADLVTLSVAGCMGAQINHEIKTDANGIKEHPVVIGIPVAQGGPTPAAEEMAR